MIFVLWVNSTIESFVFYLSTNSYNFSSQNDSYNFYFVPFISGPALVTKDEIDNPHNLNLQCVVNGVTKQVIIAKKCKFQDTAHSIDKTDELRWNESLKF